MDEITARWAARQLGELLQGRVQIAAAIIDGEYHVAERLVDNAIAQSDELRGRLAMVERRERQPHDAVARALRTDKQLIDRLLGNRPSRYGEGCSTPGYLARSTHLRVSRPCANVSTAVQAGTAIASRSRRVRSADASDSVGRPSAGRAVPSRVAGVLFPDRWPAQFQTADQ